MSYAYWRQHDGSIYEKDDGKHAPTSLLAKIGTMAIVKDGSTGWPSFDFLEFRTTVYPSIAIKGPDKTELNDTDTFSIVSSAVDEEILRLGGGKPIEPAPLLKRINKKAAQFYLQPSKRRLLVTALSLKSVPALPIKLCGCEISEVDRSNFPYPEALAKPNFYLASHLKETKYKTISVTTDQATVHQAFDTGMAALNYLRGVWTLFALYGHSSYPLSSLPVRTWIGAIHLGPVYTVHDEDSSALIPWWFSTDYVEDATLFQPEDGWEKLEQKRTWATDRIETLHYKDDLIRLLIKYANALDQTNLDVMFLMLWSLLEKITDTGKGGNNNYDETIRRTVWTYKDNDIAKEILNQLRWRRNQFVHAAASAGERDRICYITKRFVEEHLLTLIRNSFKINSIKEYGEFLATPRNIDRLTKLRDWYQTALEFHHAKQQTGESGGESEPA
jgi:hypothetical protein